MPRIQGSTFFNGSYVFVDYAIVGQNLAGNTTSINWVLGFHYGNAHFRLDNVNCLFGASPSLSGDGTGGPYNSGWPAPGGQNTDVFVDSGSFTVHHAGDGTALVTLAGSMSSDFGSSSILTSFAPPQIPQSPAAPSAATATRVNDGQINVSWTNNSTGTAPYANVKVYRQVDGGGWALRATLGVVTSYSDTGVSANHKYRYRMSAVGVNTVEVGYGTTGEVWTTPGAPTNCVATKLGNGDIQVAWANHVNYSEYLVEIQESTNGGSSWSDLNTSIASGSTSFTHVAPSTGVTHTYRVRAKTSSGTTLFSAYSGQSNTITLLATANPPTNLAPSGVARDATGAIVFTWTHNPADGTPQSSYRIQYEVDGGATQTIGPTASAVSSHTLPAATLTNGHTITWRVATAGQNGTLSADSATASFTTSAAPTVAIAAPGATHNSSSLTVEWTYFQEQSSPQAGWLVQLYNAADDLIEQTADTPPSASSHTLTAALADGATYRVRVVVRSAAGLLSIGVSQTFTVAYLPPAAATVSAAYDRNSGAMVLVINGSPHEQDVTEPIATVDVQRSIDGGNWVTFATGIVLDPVTLTTTLLDLAPTLVGTNSYRVVAFSALPSSAVSPEVQVVTAEPAWCFLSAGPGFATVVKMRSSMQIRSNTERSRALHHFAGRSRPVELTGEATNLVLSISGVLWADSAASTPHEFEAMGRTGGVVLWRDPTGRRLFGSLGRVNVNVDSLISSTVDFVVTEIDYVEGV